MALTLPGETFMIIKTNGLTFNSANPKCRLILSTTHAVGGYGGVLTAAFIAVVDDATGHVKRYWGLYDPENPADHIRHIMKKGAEWPHEFIPPTIGTPLT